MVKIPLELLINHQLTVIFRSCFAQNRPIQLGKKHIHRTPRPAAKALREWRETGPTAVGAPGPAVEI